MSEILNTIPAKFIKEEKNRFISIIEIEGVEHECYVPSSSKLSNYFNLIGETVFVVPSKNAKSRTKFTLHALLYEDKFILLNLNKSNELVKEWLKEEYPLFDIYAEKKVTDNYKADFFIESKQELIVIEVKSLFSKINDIVYPQVRSDRFLKQLNEFEILLDAGKRVALFFICLNKNVSHIKLNSKWSDINLSFKKCIKKGLEISIFETISDDKGNFSVRLSKKNVKVICDKDD